MATSTSDTESIEETSLPLITPNNDFLHELTMAANECSLPIDLVRLPYPRPLPSSAEANDSAAANDASNAEDEAAALVNRKLQLTNAVAASLISSPDFYSASDHTKMALLERLLPVIEADPEFLLKLAL